MTSGGGQLRLGGLEGPCFGWHDGKGQPYGDLQRDPSWRREQLGQKPWVTWTWLLRKGKINGPDRGKLWDMARNLDFTLKTMPILGEG